MRASKGRLGRHIKEAVHGPLFCRGATARSKIHSLLQESEDICKAGLSE